MLGNGRRREPRLRLFGARSRPSWTVQGRYIMAVVAPRGAEAGAKAGVKPRLVFFHSSLSGQCRRVEGFLAQVLQRARNHGTFALYRVAEEEWPDLVERFAIEEMPTLVV